MRSFLSLLCAIGHIAILGGHGSFWVCSWVWFTSLPSSHVPYSLIVLVAEKASDFKLNAFLAGSPETFEPHYGKFVFFRLYHI